MENSIKKSARNMIWIMVTGIAVFSVNAWILRKNFYFLFDDIAWIQEVKYQFDVRNFFHILPASRYNDRPVRTFFFWICYKLFELDYTKYYLVVLIWHIVNTFLLLKIAYEVLKKINFAKAFDCACVCALFFGIYPKNLMAVFWISGAANDLLCAFFSLLTIALYLKYINNRKSCLSVIGFLTAFILAMRSKEAAICLPVIILIYELYMAYYQKTKFKLHFGLVALSGYMILYVIRIFTLPAGLTKEGQYEQNFSIISIFQVLLNYIRMYFGLDDSAFSYKAGEYYTKIGDIGIVILAFIIAAALIKICRKKNTEYAWGILVLFLMIGLSMAPLLVLPNIQHLLYFYFPAVFLSVLFGVFIFCGWDLLQSKLKFISPCLFTLIILLILNNTGGAKGLRNSWIHWGEQALSASEDITSIAPLPAGYHLYVQGASQGANIFNYGPGYIVNILYDETDISVELEDENTAYQIPYAVWNYSDGHVDELRRLEE